MNINDEVNTPVGTGRYAGEFDVHAPDEPMETVHLVEFDVTDQVRPFMSGSNCLAPKRMDKTMFYFNDGEVSPV